jgi:CBS domain-containing protein
VTTVKDVLDQKCRDVYSVSPVASVNDALKLMADNNIASLVVLEDGKLGGIMSERIYAREIILKVERPLEPLSLRSCPPGCFTRGLTNQCKNAWL